MKKQPQIHSWQEKLAFLDAALTGKSWKDVCHNNSSQSMILEDFCFGKEYYLSDGGYSRIFWSPDDNKLVLTSNSRQEVKDAWKICKELIFDVEVECTSFFDMLLDTHA